MSGGKQVLLAEPRSLCAGVRRAMAIIDLALEQHGAPIYVRKEIVHNHHVVAEFQRRGVRFVDSEEEVPEGAVCVFSAHGVSPQVRRNADARGLDVLDATCPLVAKVHQEALRFARDGRTLLLVGHADHEEVEGTFGHAPDRTIIVGTVADAEALDLPPDAPVAYLTQTTLSVDETKEVIAVLRRRFTDLRGPATDDICFASQNRQDGIRAVVGRCDLVLVVGSTNSSNSIRMVEVARRLGGRAELVPDVTHFDPAWLTGVGTVGVSAGASAPEILVDQLLDRLAELGYADTSVERVATEDVVFSPPSRLTGAADAP
ncbi:4-hydroxy-3-methylbut-2-enyl diphosphate reductase [Umezawaea sp. Da 62-37]|uniref:4-hydroxy-3-methylbut-2-enyl diphosphate reductase n=1 Tax=Umezawaea sp. Da 62-37 TaxID=3075927 RepID=UPI0028F732F4|nr:4-hydroxy-3-methylbut-2-enyl diphosphate reductase [Umezawaea sp. Da 62-37]WNV85428.1 4-hydroxy-3-methylbut-2-enyl diphosphate reductase [Umezawaea sp. Da 62-37]